MRYIVLFALLLTSCGFYKQVPVEPLQDDFYSYKLHFTDTVDAFLTTIPEGVWVINQENPFVLKVGGPIKSSKKIVDQWK